MARSHTWRPPDQRGYQHAKPRNPHDQKTRVGKGLHTNAKSRNAAAACPYIVLDANVLLDLFSTGAQSTATVETLLGKLAKPGKSTLIIPRSVINECLNWVKHDGRTTFHGYLDLYEKPDGSLSLNTDISQLSFSDTKRIAGWLESYQKKGQLRAYRTLDEMIVKNKELESPKGGIVIIDTILEQATDEHLKGEGVVTTRVKGNGMVRTLVPPKANAHGQGDNDLSFLCRCMSAYFTKEQQTPPRFLAITSDRECREKIARSCGSYHDTLATGPLILDTNQALHGASMANLISRGNASGLRHEASKRHDTPNNIFTQPPAREAHILRTWLRGASITRSPSVA